MSKKRLTISPEACTETLAALITMAWADGHLEDSEKEGVRAAASVLNLNKELRERLESMLEQPLTVDELLFDTISPRDRAFAFVAAAWMSAIDQDQDSKELELLEQLANALSITGDHKRELLLVAQDLKPDTDRKRWADEIVTLFRAIPARMESQDSKELDVVFE